MWDMQNTDSVVDLVSGMGVPLSKLVITAPIQAYQFTLQNETLTKPGSPALEIRSLTREQLCTTMTQSNWTLERDEDQAAPYIFRKNIWIAFEDITSMDIKAKYVRIRGLAGVALKDLSQEETGKCGSTLLETVYNSLSKQSRAPRGAILHSLEREILASPYRPLDTLQLSPYRISRIIDVEGNIHSIRQDTRTEFECARQGYAVHPRSCGRFYRCVKFDQLSDEFNVFEFDCPEGLTFDSRYEVCVWPGSLPYSSACSGSSEIAPVPRSRYVCPGNEGYFADPENCRWFFACLDHGKSPLSAYEFRCPFGLVFDEERLVCEWPWLVPKCVNLESDYHETGSLDGAVLESYNGLGPLGVIPLGGLQNNFITPYTVGIGNLNVGYTGTLQDHGLLKESLHNNFQLSSQLGDGLSVQSEIQGGNVLINNLVHGGVNSDVISGQSLYNVNEGLVTSKHEIAQNVAYDDVHQSSFTNTAGLNQRNVFNVHGYPSSAYQQQTYINDVSQHQGISVPEVTALRSHEKINIADIVQESNIPILPPKPVAVVAAAPVTVIKTEENRDDGIVVNVPELQYTVTGHDSDRAYFHTNNNELSDRKQYTYGISVTPEPFYNKHEAPTIITRVDSLDNHNSYQTSLNTHPFNIKTYNVGTNFDTSGTLLSRNVQNSETFTNHAAAAYARNINNYNIQKSNSELYSYNKPALSFVQYETSPTIQTPFKTSFNEVQDVGLAKTVAQPASSFSYSFTNLANRNNYNREFVQPGPITFEQEGVRILKSNQADGRLSQLHGGFYQNPTISYEERLVKTEPRTSLNNIHQSSNFFNSAQNNDFVRAIGTVEPLVVQQPTGFRQPAFSFVENNQNYESAAENSQGKISVINVTPAIPVLDDKLTSVNVQDEYVNIPQPTITSTNILHNNYNSINQLTPTQSTLSVTPVVPVINEIKYAEPENAYEKTSAEIDQILQHEQIVPVQPVVSITPANIQTFVDVSQGAALNHQNNFVQKKVPTVISEFNFGLAKNNDAFSRIGYDYPKPAISFNEHPSIKPGLTSDSASINYQHKHEETYVSKPEPIPLEDTLERLQPIIVPNYDTVSSAEDVARNNNVIVITPTPPSIVSSTIEQNSHGYIYPQPTVSFNDGIQETYENREPVKEEPFVARKTYLTGNDHNEIVNAGYVYEKPSVQFVEQPIAPQYKEVSIATNLNHKYEQTNVQTGISKNVDDYYYATPKTVLLSTPSPFGIDQSSTPIIPKKQALGQFHYYDSRFQSTTPTSIPFISTATEVIADNREIVVTPKLSYSPEETISEKYFVNPRPKTYIKVNDLHSFLPAKLGAQCTCTTKSTNLYDRSTPDEVVDDNDGYYVNSNSNKAELDESYLYDPTPSPDLFITSKSVLPSSTPVITIKEGATSLSTTPAPIVVYDENELKEQELLTKSTIKNKVNVLDVPAYDRYGHGGVRSREETLQGTIDCQRAGLFRHPEHCNKFYACRWDCTKDRYTLHIFNCPVHLTFDNNLGACNWPSQGPACTGDTLLPNEVIH